jgi:hypothetical protein
MIESFHYREQRRKSSNRFASFADFLRVLCGKDLQACKKPDRKGRQGLAKNAKKTACVSKPNGLRRPRAAATDSLYARNMAPDTPPVVETTPEMAEILADLSRREPIFHRPEFCTTRADFERMTTEDFWEIGASGRRYSRAVVLDELEKRFTAPQPDRWETSDFRCQRLSPDVFLLTYTLVQDNTRWTRRSTIWRRSAAGWKIVYHQGTVLHDSERCER